MEMDAANGKHSVGGGSGVGSLLRPPRIFCITLLSIVFWAVIIYFVSTMQGNMASLLFKPSAFSLPSFRFGRDRCVGRYIYMYDLPPRFNADLVRRCRQFSVTDDICKLMVNDGFGAELPPGDSLPEKGAYDTDQYMLELIYHARMKRYECLTADPSTAAAVYVPFYAGFDASLNLWKSNLTDRDALSRDMADWLVRRPEWPSMWGHDHFLVAGRATWDFIRSKDGGWGNPLMTYPAIRNMTVLTIEASPWQGNDFAVPFASHFHPSSDADVLRWQDRMRQQERRSLWGFAGGPRPGNTTVRAQIIEQCGKSSSCAMFGAKSYHSSPDQIMGLLESAEFCVEPCGDSFTRKSTFDAILAGCIPVFFHPISAYTQYTWHLPRDYRSYSVFIPQIDVAKRNVSIEEELRKIPPTKVAQMREEVIRLIPRVMYREPMAKGLVFKDAFDVAVAAVIDRVAKRRRATAEGREYNDSFDGYFSWKYDLLEPGQKDIGPHEFDPYM
ncbi:hypothetical protein QYE76_027441 [Lolium multiflorum]|uniref:Exostosin GT47 domain-containing protein n=1 Tax=Lolium multiflorum TaxID=4521 RepID=A0AAD8VG31_LOLMU|nr:hypothetical protein QYE76_027441 [Lolium multiflorum]